MSSFGEPIASASVELRADGSKLEGDARDAVIGLGRPLEKAQKIWDEIMSDASKTGESIQSSFAEAGRQSDAALGKIGGPDVWGEVKREAKTAGDTIDREMRTAATNADTHLGKLGSAGAGIFRVVSTAAAAFGGAFLFKEAISGASDLNESINAVNVMFGTAAEGVHALGQSAATNLGLSEGQFNGLAVSFGAFATTIAGPGGDVAATLGDLTGRAADFASVMNLDVNDAATLFQSGLAGETEPLRKYGLDLSAAAVETYALANGITTQAGTMTEAQKVTARYGLLMEQTNKVQGDFKNTSGELANGMRILKANVLETGASFGAAFLPGLKGVTGGLNELVTSLAAPLADLGKSMGAALSPLLDALGPAFGVIIRQAARIMEDFASILGSLAPLISPIVQVVGVLATALSSTLMRVFKALEPSIAIVAHFLDVFAETLGQALFDALDALMPLMTVLGDLLGGVLAAVLPTVVQLFDTLVPPLIQIGLVLSDVLIATLPGVAAAFVSVVNAVLPLVGAGLEFVLTAVAEALTTLMPILPVIIDAFLIWKTYTIAMNALLFIFNGVLAANPIVLVGVALAALVVGVIYAYNHFQVFHDIVDAAWQIMQSVWDFITNVFVSAWHGLRDAVQTVVEKAQTLWDTLEPVRAFLAGAFALGVAYVKLQIDLLWGAFNTAKDIATDLWNGLEPVRAFLAGAFALGVDGARAAVGLLRDLFGFAMDKAQELWDKLEPFRAFMADVFALGIGVAKRALEGIRDAFGWVVEQVVFLVGWLAKIKFPDLPDWLKSPAGRINIEGLAAAASAAGSNRDPNAQTGNAIGMITSRPRFDLWGEAGKEAMIPVTMPGRAMQLMAESGLGAMWDARSAGSGWSGPALQIDHATFQDATDADSVAQKVNVAVMTRMAA